MSVIESYLQNTKAVAVLALTVTIFVAGASSLFTLSEFVGTKKESAELVKAFAFPVGLDLAGQEKIKQFSDELRTLDFQLKAMKDSAVKVPVNVDVSLLESKLTKLAGRLEVLENAISNNPEKALIVPMLRKDHELLVKQFNDSLIAIKLDYDRLWGMLMLLLTSLGAAVIVLCGWALKSVFSKFGAQNVN